MVSGLYLGHQLDDGDYSTSGSEYGDIAVEGGIYIREVGGREGTDNASGSGTASRSWLVMGSSDPLACRSALLDGPLLINTYDGLFIESLSRERHGPKSWIFTANYTPFTPDVGGYTVSIDSTGAQILQTSSYAQSRYARTGTTAPDFKKAIDVQDGAPQGVERIIPALKINVRAKIASQYVASPMRYARLIASLTGTVNNAAIFSDDEGTVFEAGELLFAGASGEIISENPQLDFIFLASQNATGLTIGEITGVNKKGHDYLWFLFDYEKDSASGLLISRPRAAYVDRVYGEADHSLLKIGAAPT